MFADTTVAGTYGSLALVGGSWTYTLDQATAQSLDTGDSVTDTITLTASDGTAQNITITVNGTEDVPIVTGTFTGIVAEGDIGDVVTATGTISISPMSTPVTIQPSPTRRLTGTYGSLALVGGSWTYTLDQAAAQSRSMYGDSVTDTITLTASDGTEQNITITVNGTEDAPIVAGTFTGTVAEGDIGDVVTATGTIAISDIDAGDNPAFADTTVAGTYGSLALVGGSWTYTLDQASCAESWITGDTVTDTITLTASDGTAFRTSPSPSTAPRTRPSSPAPSPALSQKAILVISSLPRAPSPSVRYRFRRQPELRRHDGCGHLRFVGAGRCDSWTYTLDQATAQSLDNGDTVTDIITLTASDGTAQNHHHYRQRHRGCAPVVAGTFTGAVAEGDIGDVATATGTIAISDVDTG